MYGLLGGPLRKWRREEFARVLEFCEKHPRVELGVRHVAAAAAGNEKFLPECRVLLDEEDACPKFGCPPGGHHAGGAAAHDRDVPFMRPFALHWPMVAFAPL